MTVTTFAYSRRPIETVTQDGPAIRIAGDPAPQVIYRLQYTYPTEMHVGDVADVREHAENFHLHGFDVHRQEGTVVVNYRLDGGENCVAKPAIDQSAFGARTYAFPRVGEPATVYAWTVTAERAGQCKLTFTTGIPLAHLGSIMPVTLAIYERFTHADVVTILVALISALGVITAAIIGRDAAVRAARLTRDAPPPNPPPSIILPR